MSNNQPEEVSCRKCGITSLISAYNAIKGMLIKAGYGDEIRWQETRNVEQTSEEEFLREAAWVILSGGMRESVVGDRFPFVSSAFFDWTSSVRISLNAKACRRTALPHFNHRGK